MPITEVLNVWYKIIGEFLLELGVYCTLICWKLERKESFPLRFIISLLALIVSSFCLSFVYVYIGGNAFGRMLIYAALFFIVTGLVFFFSAASYRKILFCGSLAYGLQNLTYKLFQIVWCAGEHLHLFDNWGGYFNLFYHLLYYGFLAAVVTASYFLFIRRIKTKMNDGEISVKMLVFSVILLGITIILCSVEDVYFAALCVGRETQYPSTEIYVLRQTGNLFSVVCCIVVLWLCTGAIKERDLSRELEFLKYAVKQGEWQCEISKNTIEMINIKCHDIKYRLNSALYNGHISPEAVSDLAESISIYDSRIETGNKLLDILLTEKSLFCEQNGIKFSCMADGDKLSFIADGDLYCLFGNIIDNALEAVKEIAEKERRIVNITIKVKNRMLVVQEENYYNGELTFADGLPVTTKQDKDYHGFGMRSIRMIAESYEGTLTTYGENGVFHLNILFPLTGR